MKEMCLEIESADNNTQNNCFSIESNYEQVSSNLDIKDYYLTEYEIYDGDHFVVFNIVDISAARNEITVAVSNEGKISVCVFDLRADEKNGLFFEYGVMYEKVYLKDFE